MGLYLDWGNLVTVSFPFIVSVTAAGILAIALRHLSDTEGLPTARERCVGCRFESKLIRSGECRLDCAVNALPSLPLVLFVVTTSFALLALAFPSMLLTYVLPTGRYAPATPAILVGIVFTANGAASLATAGYFVQSSRRYRRTFLQGLIVAVLLGLVVGSATTGGARALATALTPFALGSLLVGLAIEHRARMGRPALGLKALGASTVPFFIVTVLSLVRIYEILRIALAV